MFEYFLWVALGLIAVALLGTLLLMSGPGTNT